MGDTGAVLKRLDEALVKKRFDDAYRTLLTVSGIFAFAFANYATEPFSSFIYKIGIPFVLTGVVIWVIANISNKDWEYKVKLLGFTLVWFATFGLLSIVYMKDIVGTIAGMKGWFITDIVVTILLILVVAGIFESGGIMNRKTTILVTGFAFFIGLVSYFAMSL